MAAHLVDEVFPEVPVRQWVCSLPWRLRYAMGYDRRLCADVLGAFIGALTRSLRWRAKPARTHAKLLEVLERHGRSLEGVDDAPHPIRVERP